MFVGVNPYVLLHNFGMVPGVFSSGKAAVKFIFFTVLLDMLGIGLVIPIFPDVIRRFNHDPAFVTHFFGYFISIYAVMQFFASPLLGMLSDRFGRRPVLLVSMLGASLDYLMMAFAPTMGVLFLGRIISGLTGAGITVANSYMADISTDSNRSANFGMIGAAFGIGFILGPLLGGLLGSYGAHWPFIAASGLSLLNFLFGYFVLPESLRPESRRNIRFSNLNPFSSLGRLLKRKELLYFVLVYSLVQLAGQVHPSTWTLYTQYKFGWSTFQVGLSLSFVGLSIGMMQGFGTRKIVPKLGEAKAARLGLIVYVLGFAAFALATQGWMMYAIMGFFAFAGVTIPSLQSLMTKKIPANEQGELQGNLVSISSMTSMLAPIIYTSSFAFFTQPSSAVHFSGISYALASGVCILAYAMYRLKTDPT